jgi:CVNH domain-containing protein
MSLQNSSTSLPSPILIMPATGLKMLLLLVLLFWFLLTAFSPETCPPSDCFQNLCWDLSLIDGHTLHAICEGEGEVRENYLDLNLCVGVEGKKLQWEDGYVSPPSFLCKQSAR